MIADDISNQAAQARPLILVWISRASLIFSGLMLVASLLTAFAVFKHLTQTTRLVAVKPQGDFFDVAQFPDTKSARRAAANAK